MDAASPGSLILGKDRQLDLIEVDDAGLPAAAYALEEASGRFTGERLFLRNPRLYHAIVRLLGRGMPYREIEEICGVSPATVCGVSMREGIPIETIRERVGRMSFDVAMLSIEAIRDLLSDPLARAKLGLKELAIAYGIATQNGQLLTGAATARLEHVDQAPAHDDYLRMMKDVTPAPTSLSGPTPAQIAAPVDVSAAPVQEPQAPASS